MTLPFAQTPCTPQYAAPEQLFNIKTEITYKTDQFPIGIIAFFLLSSRFPYGDARDVGIEGVMNNLRHERLANLRAYRAALNDDLVYFIEKLLQVQPYKRFRNIETILRKLDEIKESMT